MKNHLYNLSFTTKIMEYVKKRCIRKRRVNVNITKFFNFDGKIWFIFEKGKNIKPQTYTTVCPEEREIHIVVKSTSKIQDIENLKDIILHESCHVMDFIRSDMKYRKQHQSKNYLDNPLTYWLDDFEFNQLINNMNKHRKEYKQEYSCIKNYDELIRFIDIYIAAGPLVSDKHLRKDKFLEKKLLKRLYREHMVPKNYGKTFVRKKEGKDED